MALLLTLKYRAGLLMTYIHISGKVDDCSTGYECFVPLIFLELIYFKNFIDHLLFFLFCYSLLF